MALTKVFLRICFYKVFFGLSSNFLNEIIRKIARKSEKFQIILHHKKHTDSKYVIIFWEPILFGFFMPTNLRGFPFIYKTSKVHPAFGGCRVCEIAPAPVSLRRAGELPATGVIQPPIIDYLHVTKFIIFSL